jgi:hypothetical protein
MARAGRSLRTATSRTRPRPFYFRGCDLTAEYLPATEEVWAQFPATAPAFARCVSAGYVSASQSFQNKSRTSLCSRVSKTQFAWGSTRAACQFLTYWGRGRQAMHLPCKQVYMGALPIDSTSLRPQRVSGRRLPRRSAQRAGGLHRSQERAEARQAHFTAGNSTKAQRTVS